MHPSTYLLIAWHMADPTHRYSEVHCYAGIPGDTMSAPGPGVTLRLYDQHVEHGETIIRSVTERGKLADVEAIVDIALARWHKGDFDAIPSATFQSIVSDSGARKTQKIPLCPRCKHYAHPAGLCQRVYRDQTRCECAHDCEKAGDCVKDSLPATDDAGHGTDG